MTRSTQLLQTSCLALGASDALAAVQSISAYADCVGPHGAYTTEIHSTRDGRVRFQQTFAGKNPYCIVMDANGAWATNTVTGLADILNADSISMIRGHEFQMLPLTLAERYSKPELVGAADWSGATCLCVRARDDLGLPCAHYFHPDTEQWMGMELSNPRQPDAQVRVLIHEWRRIENIALPARVSAFDPQGEYVFHFHTIVLNQAAPELFAPPPAMMREAHAL